jgi:hypothetical protein
MAKSIFTRFSRSARDANGSSTPADTTPKPRRTLASRLNDQPIQSLPVIEPEPAALPTDVAGAQAYLATLQQKMARLAEDFAVGKINRLQFKTIYTHYREQRQVVEALLNSMTNSTWRRAVSEGKTVILMKRGAAEILSYALYDNDSSLLLASTGRFNVDPAVVIPMLSAYRSATAEAFGGGVSNSEIEGGRWLSFLSGRYTTFIALFSLEPAGAQLALLRDLHHDFEVANAEVLAQHHGQQAAEQFMRLWTLEQAA